MLVVLQNRFSPMKKGCPRCRGLSTVGTGAQPLLWRTPGECCHHGPICTGVRYVHSPVRAWAANSNVPAVSHPVPRIVVPVTSVTLLRLRRMQQETGDTLPAKPRR